jgi:glycosyltransferase involved in cell wall biosynthesis
MRILQLTPGTGNFYCGSCMRDAGLVRALRRRGHDVLLLQLYLPLVLDESGTDASPAAQIGGGGRVFFGGINAYLQQKSWLFRHTPRWLDRLWDQPALLELAGRRAAMTDAHDLGEMTLSMLAGEEGRQKKELAKLLDWISSQGVRFDLVSLSNALLVGLVSALKRELGAPVVCSLQGEDSFLDGLAPAHRQRAWDLLRQQVRGIDGFIAPSRYYADLMTGRLGVEPARVHVAHNGIDLTGFAPPDPRPEPAVPVVGYLARMCPAKGLHTLVEAMVILHSRAGKGRLAGVKLAVAGAQTPADVPYVRELQRKLGAAGVEAEFLPNVDRPGKIQLLQSIDVFSVPATYGEVFGLYLLEAWAAGVPVVQPAHGAFPELIEATGGGVLCRPDDPAALAEALEGLLLDRERRRALGSAGQAAVKARFSVDLMAQRVQSVFESITARGARRSGQPR